VVFWDRVVIRVCSPRRSRTRSTMVVGSVARRESREPAFFELPGVVSLA
jgi:hypothetical protein